MMNFFEHQDEARQKTTLLLLLFPLLMISIIVAIYVAVLIIFRETILQESLSSLSKMDYFWNPEILILVTLGTLGTVGMGSLVKILQLRGGGKVVALSLGGRLVDRQTREPLEQRLLNVVEEMAIASGIPVPPVYLMDSESGINAFAAGFTINDAVIGITRGCVEQLSRDELQGVIAHEFSHIINGDMRLNLRLMGVLQGILLLYLLGRLLIDSGSRSSRRNRKNSGQLGILGFALMAIGWIGVLYGRLIKSAVARQREFLADASAVQFTRNPLGIAGALRKISSFASGSKVLSPKVEEASHLFFGAALGKSNFSRMFSTHPPLSERIERLEGLPKNSLLEKQKPPEITTESESSDFIPEGAIGFQGGIDSFSASLPNPESAKNIHVNPDSIVSKIGSTDAAHLIYARSLLNQLPDDVKTALRDRLGAQAVIYGLLLDVGNKTVRDRQLTHIEQTESVETLKTVQKVAIFVHKTNSRIRLPLVDLTIPTLRDLPQNDYRRFLKQIQALIQADDRLSLSEYTLQLVLMRRLRPYFSPSQTLKISYTTIDAIWNDCLIVLFALAQVGHHSVDRIEYAFRAGAERLPGFRKHRITQPSVINVPSIGKSLSRLTKAAPKVKKSIVDACAHTVLLDGEVTVTEAELLRAIVIALDCPIPPFLDRSPQSSDPR